MPRPWRHHVALIVVPLLLVMIAALAVHRRRPRTLLGSIALWLFMGLTLVVPVAMFGFFEGGYNHLLKNVLFFGGAPQAVMQRLFPAPAYEMPDNFWFEVTGVLQFFLALEAAYYLLRLWREVRARRRQRALPSPTTSYLPGSQVRI